MTATSENQPNVIDEMKEAETKAAKKQFVKYLVLHTVVPVAAVAVAQIIAKKFAKNDETDED